jgi:hypothetical protein
MGMLQQAPDNVQDGVSGPDTLTLGSDFAGVVPLRLADKRRRVGTASAAAPDAGQQPDGTQPTVPGQSAAIETRNAAANICSGVPDANPDAGAP